MDLKSNEPFWLVKNGLIHTYPSLKKTLKTEILIVGGGITGALMAHQCIEDGYETVLIDKREIANGSTSATTAMLQYEIDKPLYKLTELIGQKGAEANYWASHDSINKLETIAKKIKSNCGFTKKESLYFAAFKKDIPNLKKEFEARKACGLDVKWLSAEEIREKYELHKTYGGILSKQGGSLDAFRFTHDLLHYSIKKGLQVFDKTGIKETVTASNSITITTENDVKIQAKKVIYCTGYESTEMIKDDFVKLISTFAIIGEPNKKQQEKLKNTLFWNTADPYIYSRTTEDDRLLIGGEDEDFVNPKKRDQLIHTKSKKLQKTVAALFPNYAFKADFAWAGTFGETKDGLPYIGEHPDFKNAYFLLGFGGNGITFSVIGKKVISTLLKGEEHHLTNYFRFRR